MKKISILLVIICIASLTGCNNKVTEVTEVTEVTVPNAETTLTSTEATSAKEEILPEQGGSENTENKPAQQPPQTEYDEDLCLKDEAVIFSFRTIGSGKVLSIIKGKNDSYIVYRYGVNTNIELEFPEDKSNSWQTFLYTYYLRGGGAANAGVDNNDLYFINGDHRYQVYENYDATEDKTYVGVKVMSRSDGKTTDIKGSSSSMTGSLTSLRDSKIRYIPWTESVDDVLK